MGGQFKVHVKYTHNVLRIKQKIESISGIKYKDQRLLSNSGSELSNNFSLLKDLNIHKNSSLSLIPNMNSGKDQKRSKIDFGLLSINSNINNTATSTSSTSSSSLSSSSLPSPLSAIINNSESLKSIIKAYHELSNYSEVYDEDNNINDKKNNDDEDEDDIKKQIKDDENIKLKNIMLTIRQKMLSQKSIKSQN